MKKSYLMIAAAATMLTACMGNEMKNDVKDFGNSEISFSTYASRQTKGADNSGETNKWDLENHHEKFDVWAWKYYNGAWVSTAVYDKGTVSYASSAWSASPLRYWDKSAEKYYFYAAAPHSDNWVLNSKYTASTNEFGNNAYLSYANFELTGGETNNLSYNTTETVTTYVESFKGVNDVDLMIAEDNEVSRATYNVPTVPAVNELFDHILSRLNVTVALKAGGDFAKNNAVVKVTNFAITGVNLKNKGTFNENGAVNTAPYTGTALSSGTTARWTSLSTENAPYDLPGADISSIALTTEAKYIAQYLIIPQSITSEILDRANPTDIVYYTQAEVNTYNASLAGALNSTDKLTSEQADAFNAAMNPSPAKAADEFLDADEAAAYNAKLNGARSTSDIKSSGAAASHPYFVISYTVNEEPFTAYYNLANAFGKAAAETLPFNEGWQNTLNIKLDADIITFDAQVYEWKDNATPNVIIED